MMTFKFLPAALYLVTAALVVQYPAVAGPGHDHADSAVPTAGAALPRFAATSAAFELVGVLDGRQLTLYLDRAADNSPVKDAKLELELGGSKLDVKAHGEGEFAAVLARAPEPGVIPITATVHAGNDTERLAGELDLPAHTHAQTAHVHSWREYAVWIGGGVAALALALWGFRRVLARRAQAGGAA